MLHPIPRLDKLTRTPFPNLKLFRKDQPIGVMLYRLPAMMRSRFTSGSALRTARSVAISSRAS